MIGWLVILFLLLKKAAGVILTGLGAFYVFEAIKTGSALLPAFGKAFIFVLIGLFLLTFIFGETKNGKWQY